MLIRVGILTSVQQIQLFQHDSTPFSVFGVLVCILLTDTVQLLCIFSKTYLVLASYFVNSNHVPVGDMDRSMGWNCQLRGDQSDQLRGSLQVGEGVAVQ